ncbi:MAG: hypothetical protein L0229_25470 [Blastocatellia bacterium]|nr:hypothetical protein [Blastocatellia bacterium]
MKKLSKVFYLGSAVAVPIILMMMAILIPVFYRARDPDDRSFMNLMALIPVLLLYLAVVTCILFYRMWAAIQDGHARTSPGKAVGFLFIPFFNLYWAFQAIWGFAQDYNLYLDRQGIDAKKLPEGLFLTYVILCLTTWVPVIGPVLFAANLMFVLPVMVSKICDAINALAYAHQGAATAFDAA